MLVESELNPEQLKQVHAIQMASRTLLDVSQEMLEYSKISAGLEHFEKVEFNFYRTIRDVAYLCETLILDKDVELSIDMDTIIPEMLLGDPSKLSQVLLNLLGNSIKFMTQGEIKLAIHLKECQDDQLWLDFSISDSGIGIAEADQQKIFKSFNRAAPSTKYPGTGLGLYIVKEIVEKLNGSIRVKSTLGKGTEFQFTIPYHTGIQKIHPKKQKENHAITEIKGLRVLLIEDDPMNQELMESRLNAWGCKTLLTQSPLYALSLLDHTPIDLILMDLRLPGMNGLELAKAIRNHKNEHNKDVPIIGISADDSWIDQIHQEACINEFILKPFSPDELLLKLIQQKMQFERKRQAEPTLKIVSPSEQATSNMVELKPVLEDCMGDVELLKDLVDIFKKNVLEFVGQLKIFIPTANFKKLYFAIHKMKMGLKIMQIKGLQEIIAQMEHCCEDEDPKHMQFLYDCFMTDYPAIETALDKALEELR
jgi:CheY-like chemotaxis protein